MHEIKHFQPLNDNTMKKVPLKLKYNVDYAWLKPRQKENKALE